ncbi:MAG: hypothetical protein DRP99_04900 [Candidatus Latescibacterota bacterium]|nr:MAG: hypothetical protein DRP99_04900 [Candidatus Latescibacterota bacterium]
MLSRGPPSWDQWLWPSPPDAQARPQGCSAPPPPCSDGDTPAPRPCRATHSPPSRRPPRPSRYGCWAARPPWCRSSSSRIWVGIGPLGTMCLRAR